MGLSPLTRGNLGWGWDDDRQCGPIPAHAGQPACAPEGGSAAGAYPRSRGATAWSSSKSTVDGGLSPLTRGNLFGVVLLDQGEGPIPAHAGQPAPRVAPEWPARAYPRSRGATSRAPAARCWRMGLSPLTRGNREAAGRRAHKAGPIPAHAGQPTPAESAPHPRRAYPRSRGATGRGQLISAAYTGLSPLTRGNR